MALCEIGANILIPFIVVFGPVFLGIGVMITLGASQAGLGIALGSLFMGMGLALLFFPTIPVTVVLASHQAGWLD